MPNAETESHHAENKFHPAYTFPDADLVLKSSEGTLFRVHSMIMKLASPFFRDMIGLPQPQSGNASDDTIAMSEDKETLNNLLDMVYPDRGFDPADVTSFDLFRKLCIAAEKYDLPAAISHLRSFSSSDAHDFPPIPDYGITCRFGWVEEAKSVSSKTLTKSLHLPDTQEQLLTCSPEAILKLINLHRSRITGIAQLFELQSPELPVVNSRRMNWSVVNQRRWDTSRRGNTACSHILDFPALRAFVYRLSREMANCPRGDFLRTRGFYEEIDVSRIWSLKRSQIGCIHENQIILLKEEFIRELGQELDRLPKTI